MTAVDLFSGIGGFSLAAEAAGFEILCHVEKDERCRNFLHAHDIPQFNDIRTFPAEQFTGATIVCGGPPCQPASRAGEQRGAADDRWLWGEALRCLAIIKPTWFCLENPPGILDVGLDGILSEMERLGYEVQTFDIPACAVDSPQLRHRLWIVGYSARQRLGETRGLRGRSEERASESVEVRHVGDASSSRHAGAREGATVDGDGANTMPQRGLGESESAGASGNGSVANARREPSWQDQPERGQQGRAADRRTGADHMADATGPGCKRSESAGNCDRGEVRRPWEEPSSLGVERRQSPWSNSVLVPCADGKLRRAPDESQPVVDGLHRSLLAALGNSIVPQVAAEILKAIAHAETSR